MKSAKSRAAAARRPMIAAFMAVVLAFGGYYLYKHLSMPKVHVQRVATQWMNKSSGKLPQVIHHHGVAYHKVTAHHVGKAHKQTKAVAKHKKAKSKQQKIAAKGKSSKHKHAKLAKAKHKSSVQTAAYHPTN